MSLCRGALQGLTRLFLTTLASAVCAAGYVFASPSAFSGLLRSSRAAAKAQRQRAELAAGRGDATYESLFDEAFTSQKKSPSVI